MSRELTDTPTVLVEAPAATAKRGFGLVRGLRWWSISLVFLAAVLNYVDRQTFSALAPTIQHDLGLDDRDYGNIVNFFLLAYTISYLIAGRVADLLGTRIGMAIFVGWWSLANMVTVAARGVDSMSSFQFMLGVSIHFETEARGGAIRFSFEPGHDYCLAGGAETNAPKIN